MYSSIYISIYLSIQTYCLIIYPFILFSCILVLHLLLFYQCFLITYMYVYIPLYIYTYILIYTYIYIYIYIYIYLYRYLYMIHIYLYVVDIYLQFQVTFLEDIIFIQLPYLQPHSLYSYFSSCHITQKTYTNVTVSLSPKVGKITCNSARIFVTDGEETLSCT